MPDCESDDPDDCRYWCYKPLPAEFKTMPVEKLVNDATVIKDNYSWSKKILQKKSYG